MNCKICGSVEHVTAQCSPEIREAEGRLDAGATVEEFEAGEREYARDLFAASAMQGLIGIPGGDLVLATDPDGYRQLAVSSYAIADAMMAERDKRRNPGG